MRVIYNVETKVQYLIVIRDKSCRVKVICRVGKDLSSLHLGLADLNNYVKCKGDHESQWKVTKYDSEQRRAMVRQKWKRAG